MTGWFPRAATLLRTAALLVVTVLVVTLTGAPSRVGAAEAQRLSFGVSSDMGLEATRRVWEPFFADMARLTGLAVSGYYPPDNGDLVDAFASGRIDVAWTGNKAAIEAVDRAGAEVFGQVIDAAGNPGYWSVLITRDDSGLATLDQVLQQAARLRFGNGDPTSTSGNLVPGYYVFAKNGLDARKLFAAMRSGNHEDNIRAVLGGEVDVATNNTITLEAFEKTNPADHARLRIIWRSPLLPSDPLVWRGTLSDGLKRVVRAFLLSYGRTSPEQKAILASLNLGGSGFRASTNDQLVPIRIIGLMKERARVEAAPGDEAVRRARLEAIDLQLKALQ